MRRLGESELRALLDGGRPEQRVWALWTLALRAGELKDLIDVASEPDPGVRRHLAVMLAGHAEYELLLGLAQRDPSPEVRAAAMQLVARLALDGVIAPLFVSERAVAEQPAVKMAILGVAFAKAPPWLVEIVEKLLDDPDLDVRFEAFEACLRIGANARALPWLEDQPETDARIVLMRWTARTVGAGEKPADRMRACATTLANASRRLRRLFVETVRFATWHDLAPVIGDDAQVLRTFVRRDHAAIAEVPLGVLMRATLREHDAIWLAYVHRRIAALEHPDLDIAELLPDYVELVAKRLEAVDAELVAVRTRTDIEREDIEAMEDERDRLAAALDHAARLAVH